MGVMCSTSQCELRSTFPNLRVTNVIRIVTFYTMPPLESPTSSWMTRSHRSRRRDKGLCKIPLMALPRNGYTIACHGKGRLTLWRICLQTQCGQLECSVGRPVRGADGNKDWERWTERHHVIPGTSGGMDRLISHISIPISAYLSDALDHCYSPEANSSSETPHKE